MTETAKQTVLVVDDEPDVRFFIETVLKDGGFEVVSAGNGKQALDRIQERVPDLISLDLVMPKMSGLKFFLYLQKNKERRGIPFLVVTAHGKDEMGRADLKKILAFKRQGVRLGVVEKPIVPDQYLAAVRELLGLPEQDHVLSREEQERAAKEAALARVAALEALLAQQKR